MEAPRDVSTVALVEANSNPLGVALVNTQRTNKSGDANDLVALAIQVQKADECTRSVAGSKLGVIAEQIKFLQAQALRVMQEAKLNADLNHAACNMVKKPGNIYHLYQRDSGQKYLSIISPEEWGAACPHVYISSHRLEYDMSWTPIDKLNKRDDEEAMVSKILRAGKMIGPATAGNVNTGNATGELAGAPLMALMDAGRS
jgi:hypothetical protein